MVLEAKQKNEEQELQKEPNAFLCLSVVDSDLRWNGPEETLMEFCSLLIRYLRVQIWLLEHGAVQILDMIGFFFGCSITFERSWENYCKIVVVQYRYVETSAGTNAHSSSISQWTCSFPQDAAMRQFTTACHGDFVTHNVGFNVLLPSCWPFFLTLWLFQIEDLLWD